MSIVIAVINESTAISDQAVRGMIPALGTQLNRDLRPAWDVVATTLIWQAKGRPTHPGWWECVFLDDSDQAGALAYHDLTSQGLPLSKIFVRTLENDGASVTVGASHELCEMVIDPWLQYSAQDANGTFWALEICDAVEGDAYGYEINGIKVTDFVMPDWFTNLQVQGPFDHGKHANQAFTVLPEGYSQYWDATQGWVQVFGEKAQSKSRAVQPAHGSRRDRRSRGVRDWKRSGK